MKILVPGIIVFAIWCYISANWYVCHIKYLCDDTEVASTTPASIPESADASPLEEKEIVPEVFTEETDNGMILYFATGSANPEVDVQLNNLLQKFADQNQDRSFLIIGHTDSVGNEEKNYELGLARANTVKSILLDLGLSETNISVDSKGEQEPLSAEKLVDTASNRNNRRVEILFN